MKCALAVVLAALLGTELSSGQMPLPAPMPKGVTNPIDLLKLASLFGCRMNGIDGGIDGEFARTMLGFGSANKMRRCMIGCFIGWLHTTNHFMHWEFGVDMVPHFPGKIMKNIQTNVQGCITQALNSGKKCSMVQELLKCFIKTERDTIINKFKKIFMPWLPCWDYLKTKIPVVRTIDKLATKLEDNFIQGLKKGIGDIFLLPGGNTSNLDLGSAVTAATPFIGPPEKPGTQRPRDSNGDQPVQQPATNKPEEPVTIKPEEPPVPPPTIPPPKPVPELPPNPPTEPPPQPSPNP